MTSVDETLPISDQDKETEPVNDEVEANTGGQETQIENKEEQAPTSNALNTITDNKQQDQTPTEFCEEIKEKTRVQKLFECPKCKKMLTKKTLNYYHECTKNDLPKAKRRPKKQIVLEEIAEEDVGVAQSRRATGSSEPKQPNGQTVPLKRQTNQIVEQGEKFLNSINLTNDVEQNPPSYEDLRRERLQQRIQQRNVKIQQLFQSAI